MPDATTSVEEVVAQLQHGPVRPAVARQRPKDGGVPAVAGLYAWWAESDAIGELPLARPPGSGFWLLYVGSAPTRPGSAQTLRTRVCSNDLRGGPADSPLRRTLCALLWQDQHWSLGHSGDRVILSRDAQSALAEWQAANMRVSWATRPKPWVERPLVARVLGAPLNLAEDRNHPYHWLASEARQRLRTAALSAP